MPYLQSRCDLHVVGELSKQSMQVIIPVHWKVPLISVHNCIDSCTVLWIGPLHELSLGVSKPLKEICLFVLYDSAGVSATMVTGRGEGCRFPLIRTRILKLLNVLLSQTQKTPPGCGVHLNFFNIEPGSC